MLRIGQVESTATSGGQYTDGNFAGGIAATRLRAAAFNAIQEELANIVESAGITLSPDDSTQVLAALNKQFQASDKTLTALAGLLTGANKLPYFTGNYTADQTDLTKVGRDIIGMDTVSAVLVYLGLNNLPKTFGAAASMNVGKAPGTVAAGDDSRFSQMIGVGQTWQEVSASRASGVVYTNTTGKPIQVSICTGTARPCFMYVDSIFVSNTVVTSSGTDIGAQLYLGSVIVPNNSTYRAEAPNIISWIELR
ncbi:hypothetical protein [Edwardsiella tarda]|uniref:hypothetical protein n=1 Tax=Edwardsiella tarda TaxID=636 RepID=UPI00351C3FB8